MLHKSYLKIQYVICHKNMILRPTVKECQSYSKGKFCFIFVIGIYVLNSRNRDDICRKKIVLFCLQPRGGGGGGERECHMKFK